MNLFGALAHLGADMERASIWKLNQLNQLNAYSIIFNHYQSTFCLSIVTYQSDLSFLISRFVA